MKAIRHLHSSSRFNRTPRSLRIAARAYNRWNDIVTYTEVEHEVREQALRAAADVPGDRFGVVTGDKSYSNDCAVTYRVRRFRLVHAEHTAATKHRYTNVRGLLRDPAFGTYVVLEDKESGRRVVVAVIHLASSVQEAIKDRRRTSRTVAWFTAFSGSRMRANRLKRKYKADAILYVADFNLDFKVRWVRVLIKALAPRYHHTWKNLPAVGGTHGGKVIDASLIKGGLKVVPTARLSPDDQSSDHRPYREVLEWKE